VDYIGIAQALKQAMQDYTKRDRQRFGDPDIQKTALVKFKEKLEICRDLLFGYDYSGFYEGSNVVKGDLILGGANFLIGPKTETRLKDYLRESELLHNAETLCRSLLSREIKLEVAFMDAVRVMLTRFRQTGKISKKEINDRIARLLEQSIQSKGVVPLVIGDKVEFSLFDDAFLEEVRKMKTRNLAVQLLEKLIKEQLHTYERTNIVQSRKFSEMLSQSLSNYLKGMLTNEQVIEELLKMAEAIKSAEKEGNDLGLNPEEKAFYDALSTPEGIKEAYTSEQFVALTKALTEELRKNRTIDWNRKEQSRAKMRVMVKRLLKIHNYPPEGQEQALETVMAQCNKWADDEENFYE
jgi:type I restriction enzyme R subunit